MAYSDEQWLQARGFYEAGLSLSKIKEKTGIARNTVSKRAKREQWEHGANAEYVEARVIVNEKKGTILQEKGTLFLNALDEVADDKVRRRGLVFGASELLLKKTVELIDKGKASKIVSEGHGLGVSSSREMEVDLQSADYKNLADTIDKASLTLGVNQRFSSAKVEVNNQNNQQNNVEIVGYSVKTIDKD